MADDGLEFVAVEQVQRTARHRDGGVLGRVAGGEGVDAELGVHDEDARHGNAGGERHLLHHVEEPALPVFAGRGEYLASVQRCCHGGAALGKLRHLDERGHADDDRNDAHGPGHKTGVGDDLRERDGTGGSSSLTLDPLGEHNKVCECNKGVDGQQDGGDKKDVDEDEPSGRLPCFVLMFEEVHFFARLRRMSLLELDFRGFAFGRIKDFEQLGLSETE